MWYNIFYMTCMCQRSERRKFANYLIYRTYDSLRFRNNTKNRSLRFVAGTYTASNAGCIRWWVL